MNGTTIEVKVMDETKAAIQVLEQSVAQLQQSVARLDAKLDVSVAQLDAKLDQSVARLDRSVAELSGKFDRLDAKIERVLNTVVKIGGELHTENQAADIRAHSRMDEHDSRFGIHAGLLQSGSRAMTRFIRWSERHEVSMTKAIRRLDRAEARVLRLESRSERPSA